MVLNLWREKEEVLLTDPVVEGGLAVAFVYWKELGCGRAVGLVKALHGCFGEGGGVIRCW